MLNDNVIQYQQRPAGMTTYAGYLVPYYKSKPPGADLSDWRPHFGLLDDHGLCWVKRDDVRAAERAKKRDQARARRERRAREPRLIQIWREALRSGVELTDKDLLRRLAAESKGARLVALPAA